MRNMKGMDAGGHNHTSSLRSADGVALETETEHCLQKLFNKLSE